MRPDRGHEEVGMGKLGLIVGVLALALAGYAAMELCAKDQEITGLKSANEDLLDRVTVMEAKLADAFSTPPEATLVAVKGSTGDTTRITGLKGSVASPLARLASLEKTVASQNDLIAKLKETSAASAPKQRGWGPRGNSSFYGNLDSAAKALELKETQKADMKELQERGRQELKDLYAIENDDGVTWAQARKPHMVGGEGITFAMPDMAKLAKFKKNRIPGSSETFGEAQSRIRKDAFGRMRDLLTPTQAKKWDKANKSPLLGAGRMGAASISFVSLGSGG
jgi:hypothetical protein